MEGDEENGKNLQYANKTGEGQESFGDLADSNRCLKGHQGKEAPVPIE